MKFRYTIIYVDDVPKTVEFYEKAFSLQTKFIHESNQYAEMDTGWITLVFASEALIQHHGIPFRPNRPGDTPAGFEIALVTEHVHDAFEKALKEGAQLVARPAQKPWGQTVAYVRDLNGVLVELCSPMDE